jgi:hypothetical protein
MYRLPRQCSRPSQPQASARVGTVAIHVAHRAPDGPWRLRTDTGRRRQRNEPRRTLTVAPTVAPPAQTVTVEPTAGCLGNR